MGYLLLSEKGLSKCDEECEEKRKAAEGEALFKRVWSLQIQGGCVEHVGRGTTRVERLCRDG